MDTSLVKNILKLRTSSLAAWNGQVNTSEANLINSLEKMCDFQEVLSQNMIPNEELEAVNIAKNVQERLQKLSFGSSKVKLIVSPEVYIRMAKDEKFKNKMNKIFDDYLSENGTLSWITRIARLGGGEISLTVSSDGSTQYTGKLYCVPGWEEDKELNISTAEKLKKKFQNQQTKYNVTDIWESELFRKQNEMEYNTEWYGLVGNIAVGENLKLRRYRNSKD